MTDCGCEFEPTNDDERHTLVIVLVINAAMFLIEFTGGIWADSMGLIADSLDMFADASVYGISLFAIGRSIEVRNRAAMGSGIFQIILGLGVFIAVVNRFVFGAEPLGVAMMLMGLVALAANGTCLGLLYKHRHGDVNMRASWIFSTNDVIANVGVILSGGLVWLLDSMWPDLVIGSIIAAVVIRGGSKIIREVNKSCY